MNIYYLFSASLVIFSCFTFHAHGSYGKLVFSYQEGLEKVAVFLVNDFSERNSIPIGNIEICTYNNCSNSSGVNVYLEDIDGWAHLSVSPNSGDTRKSFLYLPEAGVPVIQSDGNASNIPVLDAILLSAIVASSECGDCARERFLIAEKYMDISGCFRYQTWKKDLLIYGDRALMVCKTEVIVPALMIFSDREVCANSECVDKILSMLFYLVRTEDSGKFAPLLDRYLSEDHFLTDPYDKLLLALSSFRLGVTDESVLKELCSILPNVFDEREQEKVHQQFRCGSRG